jgi:hypothetical protein
VLPRWQPHGLRLASGVSGCAVPRAFGFSWANPSMSFMTVSAQHSRALDSKPVCS